MCCKPKVPTQSCRSLINLKLYSVALVCEFSCSSIWQYGTVQCWTGNMVPNAVAHAAGLVHHGFFISACCDQYCLKAVPEVTDFDIDPVVLPLCRCSLSEVHSIWFVPMCPLIVLM